MYMNVQRIYSLVKTYFHTPLSVKADLLYSSCEFFIIEAVMNRDNMIWPSPLSGYVLYGTIETNETADTATRLQVFDKDVTNANHTNIKTNLER